MALEAIPTPSRPFAAGPYSPALRADEWIVCSGQVGVDPATSALVAGGVVAEARQALGNVTAILDDCGASWADVAKVTLFVATEDAGAMPDVNAVYAEVVGEHRPARSTVGVAWLPMGAAFEVEVWVHQPV